MRRIFILFYLLFAGGIMAQEMEVVEHDFVENREIKFRESLLFFHVETNVPNVMASPGFRNSFKGIYEVGGSINIRLASGFSMGIGGANSLISTRERIQSVDMRMQLYTAVLKFAYNRYHTEKTYSTLGFNVGQNRSFFTNVIPIHSPILDKNYSSFLLEPEYSINFVVEESFSIGIYVSYTFLTTPFNPYNIGLQDYTPLALVNVEKPVGILNFGFCFYVGMGKRFKVNVPERDK